MPRKGHIAKREVAPDPIYGSTLVTKFVNSMMWGGKKSTAQKIFYESMTNLEQKGGAEALKMFKKAVENVKPLLEGQLRPFARRKGHGRQAHRRTARRSQRPWCSYEEEGRRAPHGGSQ